jgi:hypothetical protein
MKVEVRNMERRDRNDRWWRALPSPLLTYFNSKTFQCMTMIYIADVRYSSQQLAIHHLLSPTHNTMTWLLGRCVGETVDEDRPTNADSGSNLGIVPLSPCGSSSLVLPDLNLNFNLTSRTCYHSHRYSFISNKHVENSRR